MILFEEAESVVAVEYTDCISAEGYDLSNECPGLTLNNQTVSFH